VTWIDFRTKLWRQVLACIGDILRNFMMKTLVRLACFALVVTIAGADEPPDLTAGAKPDTTVTYNLGPTGMRGWIYNDWGSTELGRQILVTAVEENSPAHGLVEVKDIILGLDGQPFSSDARIAFGRGIDIAESEKRKGLMQLTLWRQGETREVTLPLKVMGSYSDTAPYKCKKSAKILQQGCDLVAARKAYGRFSLGALALLASGDPKHAAQLKAMGDAKLGDPRTAEFIRKVAESDSPMGSAWNGGYGELLWMEYFLATGDERFLPYIRAVAINTARGGSMWGTYGHGFSMRKENGELHGVIPPYGALNQAGLGCFLAMTLAKEAGVEDAEVDAAVARSAKFFGYYAGKGAIPYGEFRPHEGAHSDNGKEGMAALTFALRGQVFQAKTYASMCTASSRDREHGHTGPYPSYLWSALGAAVGGEKAAAAYFKEVSWHYDMQRRWDGDFVYEWGGGSTPGAHYRGISSAAAYLLTYALPESKTYITGKGAKRNVRLNKRDVAAAIEAGHFASMGDKMSTEELFSVLSSWSPVVRIKAGNMLAHRDDVDIGRLIHLAEGKDANARVGACHTMAALKEGAVPAIPVLIRLLRHEDRWLRIQAAEVLKSMGEAARPAVNEMLVAVVNTDAADPLQLGQGRLAYALFYPGGNVAGHPGLLAKSIDGVDRDLLYPAIRAVALNPDGHVRGCLRSTYAMLTLEDVKVLMPDIAASITDMAPCNTMFSKGVMLSGLNLLARHRIEAGVELTMNMFEGFDFHGKGYVKQVTSGILRQYGAGARPMVPRLQAMQLATPGDSAYLQEIIDVIESDTNAPSLLRLVASE
jgi:hypothetical protein